MGDFGRLFARTAPRNFSVAAAIEVPIMISSPISSLNAICTGKSALQASCMAQPTMANAAAVHPCRPGFVPACRPSLIHPGSNLRWSSCVVPTDFLQRHRASIARELAVAITTILDRYPHVIETPAPQQDTFQNVFELEIKNTPSDGFSDIAIAEANQLFLQRYVLLHRQLVTLFGKYAHAAVPDSIVTKTALAYYDRAEELRNPKSEKHDILAAVDHYSRAALILRSFQWTDSARYTIRRAFSLLKRSVPSPSYPVMMFQLAECFDKCAITDEEVERHWDEFDAMLQNIESLARQYKQYDLIRDTRLIRTKSPL